MKIALAQLNYHIGNFSSNASKMIASIAEAKQQGTDLIVFAELAVCGYPPRDFLEFDDFIQSCYTTLAEIATHCVGISAIVGSPSNNKEENGKPLYNSAFFLSQGEITSVFHKKLLPTYDVFDEYRYFESSKHTEVLVFQGKKLAITICEDLWNVGDNRLYRHSPMDDIAHLSPDIIINIAASPFYYAQKEERLDVLRQNALAYNTPIVYVNHVGAQTELIFDGGSLAMNASGHVIQEAAMFQEDMLYIEDAVLCASGVTSFAPAKTEKTERIHQALVLGIKNYFEKLGFKKAILGLSGGIDSAVTLALAVEALGAENVLSVLMPSEFSSNHSIDDAKALAENLRSPYHIIPIKEAYDAYTATLSPYFQGLSFNIAEENLQSRSRGVLLMALSNKFGYILLNTSNKSEVAVGYGTLYGDMCGGLSVIGDVYKTEVFELARYINREKEIIPMNTILKPPSAELRPNQKDSDSLPDYDVLDQILYHYIEKRQGPKELVAMGFDQVIVDKTLRLVNTNEYKRHQTPPILRVSPKAFGMGRRMPIVGKYLS